MARFVDIACLALALFLSAGPAFADPAATRIGPAESRILSPGKPCAAVQAVVAQSGSAIVAQSAFVYERVFRDSGACRNEVTSEPAFTPTLDQPQCFAGYRCKQRGASEGGQR